MRLNKTQAHMLRTVFGSDTLAQGGTRSEPHNMIVRVGSREHSFGKELERIGIARIITQEVSGSTFTFVTRACR